jgi:prolipoprotein diacylglyceryltransferase
MIAKHNNNSTTDQRTHLQEEQRFLNIIFWSGVLVWAGLVFMIHSLGYLPEVMNGQLWGWIFLGAGIFRFAIDLFRLISPNMSSPETWDYFWAGTLVLIGLGSLLIF